MNICPFRLIVVQNDPVDLIFTRLLLLCGLPAKPVEGVVAEHVALHSRGCAPAARTHDQHQLAAGHAAQQALGERGAQEPGRAGDSDALAGERLDDHAVSSSARGRERLTTAAENPSQIARCFGNTPRRRSSSAPTDP